MLTPKHSWLSLCVLLTVLLSCKESKVEPPPLSAVGPTEERLHFASWEDFDQHLRSLSKGQQNAQARQNFVSYYDLQEGHLKSQASARTGTSTQPTIVKREVTIGADSVYRFGSDYTFAFHKRDTALITQFYADLNKNLVSVPKGKLFLYKNKLKVAKTQQSIFRSPNAEPACQCSTNGSIGAQGYFNDSERVIGEVWTGNWFFYSACGVKTRGERKGRSCFLWWCWDSWGQFTLTENSIDFTAYGDNTLARHVDGMVKTFPVGQRHYLEYKSLVYNDTNDKTLSRMYGWSVPNFIFYSVDSYHHGKKGSQLGQIWVKGSIW
jgi:hypothetical protein